MVAVLTSINDLNHVGVIQPARASGFSKETVDEVLVTRKIRSQ
jgi:hypothetical protein